MTEFTMDRLRENLENLETKSMLEILDNYLEWAMAENLNIVEVLDYIFLEEANFPFKKILDDFDSSFQPSIGKRQIDEPVTMRFLENGEIMVPPREPDDVAQRDFFRRGFPLFARQYEKTSTVFTFNKTFSQWDEVFAEVNTSIGV